MSAVHYPPHDRRRAVGVIIGSTTWSLSHDAATRLHEACQRVAGRGTQSLRYTIADGASITLDALMARDVRDQIVQQIGPAESMPQTQERPLARAP